MTWLLLLAALATAPKPAGHWVKDTTVRVICPTGTTAVPCIVERWVNDQPDTTLPLPNWGVSLTRTVGDTLNRLWRTVPSPLPVIQDSMPALPQPRPYQSHHDGIAPDTSVRWTGTQFSYGDEQIARWDTTITYHSLSQLPKDTTKRWNDPVITWRWEAVFYPKDTVVTFAYSIPEWPETHYTDSIFRGPHTSWRFIPDSVITEVKK